MDDGGRIAEFICGSDNGWVDEEWIQIIIWVVLVWSIGD